MGEFPASKVLIGTVIYFFVFYLICWAVQGEDSFDSSEVNFNDPGFSTSSATTYDGDTLVTLQNDTSFSSVSATLSMMSGIGTNNVSIGIPSLVQFIFHFIFFWIPLALFGISLYFTLPFIH